MGRNMVVVAIIYASRAHYIRKEDYFNGDSS